MKYIVNAREMQSIDACTINDIGISSEVLMEKAAMAVADAVLNDMKKTDRILVVCGTGNNGGDGIAAARILSGYFDIVHIFLVGDIDKVSEETKKQIVIAENLNLIFLNKPNYCEYNGIIDALFGIGLSRSVEGLYEQIIRQINACPGRVFSVDIPSGVNAADGTVLGHAVNADVTITFGFLKQGILFYPGREYAGKILIADIGFPIQAVNKNRISNFYYEKDDLGKMPIRRPDSHKGDYGKVLIAAGNQNMSGACYLCAKAAYRMGAGLVKILTCNENRIVLQTLLPEAIVVTYQSEKRIEGSDAERIIKELDWATTIAAGPGLGLSETAADLLELIICHRRGPLVLDADALNLLAKRQMIRNDSITADAYSLGEHVILTPHKKEMSRLLHQGMTKQMKNPVQTAKDFAKKNGITLVLKDAVTLVTRGDEVYFNNSGNHGMATGGSGDVLAGIISGLLAQGMEDFDSAALAVYIHGLAGDKAAEKKSGYSLMAGDIIEALPDIFAAEVQDGNPLYHT